MAKTSIEAPVPAGEARLKWKTLALCSVVFALVCLTALAVVTTITRADVLSVVALALAVMAFVVQIIVFIVQGFAASKQAADAAALNAETLRALAAIEEKSEGTRQTVGAISDRLLTFAFNKASSEAEAEALGDDSTPRKAAGVLQRAREVLDASSNPSNARDVHTSPNTSLRNASAGQSSAERTFLDEPLTPQDVQQVETVLERLGDNVLALLSLQRLGSDLQQAEEAGHAEGAGLGYLNEPKVLYEVGLIERIRSQYLNGTVFVLTQKGKLVAQALLNLPAASSSTVHDARKKIADFLGESKQYEDELERVRGQIPISE